MSELISEAYLWQLQKLREVKPNWGNGGQAHVERVIRYVVDRRFRSVLDYGCGKGILLAELAKRLGEKVSLAGYDPGIPERAALPEPADLVVSTDVLEHIEPELLDNVLQHLASLTKRAAYVNIHTMHANTTLPDGRNAHLTQQPAEWWQKKLEGVFPAVTLLNGGIRPTFLCER